MTRWGSRLVVSASLALLSLGALTLGGCSTEAYGKRSARTARGFQEHLQEMPAEIDAVMSDLNTLTAGTTTNRPEVLKQYNKDLERLHESAEDVAHARDRAQKNSQKYFREWLQDSRSYKDPAKRDAALKSLESGQSNVDLAVGYLNQAAKDYWALHDQLANIQSTFKKDLSPATVQRVGSNLGPVLDQANNVKQYIARLDEQIDAALAGR